ncbi:MAG: coproporphyrinogen III oxidase family protein, partial [Treponema sp.]|nr:coproporphyrinogen III oxidase family protein [Treponema sp.]
GDLMSGLPFQNERILMDDIDALLCAKPAHVSLYALTLEPETPLARADAETRLFPPPDEADRLWICGRDVLERSGFSQYEVSNFCLPGKESRHNIRYWRMQNWLALGPAASGTIIADETARGVRWTVPTDADAWLADTAAAGAREKLDSVTLIKETILMGFRHIEGPDEALFRRRFRRGIESYIPDTIGAWRRRGLAQDGKIALTRDGLVFLNAFLVDAFREMDSSPP